ncbi:MAG: epoxyqueuosine reductase QueH [bacterium]|nr:epoxyqueuosine reductase QueH [bacterium]
MENISEKFLLHACCAPCGITVIDELRKQYNLAVFFYNPNIFPEAEYLKRKAEIIKLCREWNVPVIDGDYESDVWNEAVRGLEREPEGGARCSACFSVRLEKTAAQAKKLHADVFGTTLSMGRNKNAATINAIGRRLGDEYGVEFLEEDWKKNGRQEIAGKMVAERKIYRQNYCGCKYSLRKS